MTPDGPQLGDDIGKQPIFELADLVFDLQLLLFEPSQRQLVVRGRQFDAGQFSVEIAMLSSQAGELFAQQCFIRGVHQVEKDLSTEG